MREHNRIHFKFVLVLFVGLCAYGLYGDGKLQSVMMKSISPPEEGRVIAVYDGDTIQIRLKDKQSWKVRLIGVNAPEIGVGREEMQFRAEMSKKFAFHQLYKKKVRLSYESEIVDKYGRLLAYVWTEEEGLFNKFIISEGFASAYLNFDFQYRDEFKEAERVARRNEKGYWKRGGYSRVEAEKAKDFVGQLMAVEFTCARVKTKGKFVYLYSSGEKFSALIPKKEISAYQTPQSYMAKAVSVSGFLEEYKGELQIMVFFPFQVEIIGQ